MQMRQDHPRTRMTDDFLFILSCLLVTITLCLTATARLYTYHRHRKSMIITTFYLLEIHLLWNMRMEKI